MVRQSDDTHSGTVPLSIVHLFLSLLLLAVAMVRILLTIFYWKCPTVFGRVFNVNVYEYSIKA